MGRVYKLHKTYRCRKTGLNCQTRKLPDTKGLDVRNGVILGVLLK